MRQKLIGFLKKNPRILDIAWKSSKLYFNFLGRFYKPENKIVFASFGGRNFNDSPKALFEEIIGRKEFEGWDFVWVFAEPDNFEIPGARKVKIDSKAFFKELLTAKVWISNSGMDRGIGINSNGIIKVETWHGSPLKKIGGEEHKNSMLVKKRTGKVDTDTIRCAQSDYDREIFARIFNASKDAILLADLPRNDSLLKYTDADIKSVREALNIPDGKKVILYVPTYREYLINKSNEFYFAPPIDLDRWEKELGDDYVLLFRAHYAVNAALGIKDTSFIRNVTDYDCLNDLFAVCDMMISDYSGSFTDYSILDRPMLCFAYDLEEYEEQRGLYLDLEETLPCPVTRTEDQLLEDIKTIDFEKRSQMTKEFHQRFAPYAGNASKTVVDEIIKRLKQ